MHLSVFALILLVASSCGAAWWANRRRPDLDPPAEASGAIRGAPEPAPQAAADEA